MRCLALLLLMSSPAVGQSIVLRNTLPDQIMLWVLQKPAPAQPDEWFTRYLGRNASVSLSLQPPGKYYVTFYEGRREMPVGWVDFHRIHQKDPQAEVSLRAVYEYEVSHKWPPEPAKPIRVGQELIVHSRGKTYRAKEFTGESSGSR
jgi:hypothetical protein